MSLSFPLIKKELCPQCNKVRYFRAIHVFYFKRGYSCTKCGYWYSV